MEYNPNKYRFTKAFLLLLIFALVAVLYLYRGFLFSGLMGNNQQKEAPKKEEQKVSEENKLSVADEKKLQEQAEDIVQSGDPQACQKIENEMYQKVCRNNIFLKKAEKENNAAYCRELDGKMISVENCERQIVMQKSIEKGDASVCQEASQKEVRVQCEENFWPKLALQKQDIGICAQAKDQEIGKKCKDMFYFYHDFSPNPQSFGCSNFSDESLRTDCEIYKSNLSQKKTNPCENLKTGFVTLFCQNAEYQKQNIQ